jgi:hypothetical protein
MNSSAPTTKVAPSISHSRGRWHLSITEKLLCVLFLLALPFLNPWVRGDGVGYYAFVRAPLVERSFHFENDWKHADAAFRLGRIDDTGNIEPGQYTKTGHLDNHFAVGPALLWLPFLAAAHVGVLTADGWGAHIPADGFSRPYRAAMAFGTALCGFLGLWLSYRVVRKYLPEYWAAAGTLGIWFGSSLIVYMIFNPSWSHAQSAFAVALFVWYWDRTRGHRTPAQWCLLGLLGGLMTDVYYPNVLIMLLPLTESVVALASNFRKTAERTTWRRLFAGNLLCGMAFVIALLPTFVSRQIIYGSPFQAGTGYTEGAWHWAAPARLSVLFSADHGLFSWTPLIPLSLLGLFFLWRVNRMLAAGLGIVFLAYYYLIASYSNWNGLSSFGNRFFVSLTPIFVIGLAALLSGIAERSSRAVSRVTVGAVALLVVWNLGMVFQWGTHLIPPRGPISWRQMAYNQVAVVPLRAVGSLRQYCFQRKELMGQIEKQDVEQIKKQYGQAH